VGRHPDPLAHILMICISCGKSKDYVQSKARIMKMPYRCRSCKLAEAHLRVKMRTDALQPQFPIQGN